MRRIKVNAILLIFLLLCLLLGLKRQGLAYERYVLEKQWPASVTAAESLHQPHGIVIDSGGNVFVADTYNHRIVKYSSSGKLLLKWGTYGSKDGGFNFPHGIAIDSADNIYVADSDNERIQKFDNNGNFLLKWGGTEGNGIGQFKHPRGVAVDKNGYVYVADTDNNRVQKFTSIGDYVTQFTGIGSTLAGLAVDDQGYIYVASYGSDEIIKLDAQGKVITSWKSYNYPYGVTIGPDNNVYVAKWGSNSVVKYSPTGGYLAWASASAPRFIAFDKNNMLYVTCGSIKVFNERLEFYRSFGGNIESADEGKFSNPRGVARDTLGNIYVADTYNNRIQKFSAESNFLKTWGSEGSAEGQFKHPYGVAIDKNNYIYVTDFDNNRVQKFTSDGVFITQMGAQGGGDEKLDKPFGITVDSESNVYVTEYNKDKIKKYSSAGNFVTSWENGNNMPFGFGITTDPDDNVYAVTFSTNQTGIIEQYSSAGIRIKTYDGGDSLYTVLGIDKTREEFIIISGATYRMPMDGTGSWTRIPLEDQYRSLSNVGGLAVDSSGNIVVTDPSLNQISTYRAETYYIIEGKVKNKLDNGVVGVKLTLQGGATPQEYTTEGSSYFGGTYSFKVSSGGNYVLMPTLADYTFEPSSFTYTNVSTNFEDQDFIATHTKFYIVGGYVRNEQNQGIPGITIRLSGEATSTIQTDETGHYEFQVLDQGYYSIAIVTDDTIFYKPFYGYSEDISKTTSDYNFTVYKYKISGRILDARGEGIAGVTVTLTGNAPDEVRSTDSAGYYEFIIAKYGYFDVTVSKDNHSFTPKKRTYEFSSSASSTWYNYPEQNFTGLNLGVATGDIAVSQGVANIGKNEKIIVTVYPPVSGTISARIYNFVGELVWSNDIEVFQGVPALISWDGHAGDKEGNKAAAGVYIIYLDGAGVRVKRKVVILK